MGPFDVAGIGRAKEWEGPETEVMAGSEKSEDGLAVVRNGDLDLAGNDEVRNGDLDATDTDKVDTEAEFSVAADVVVNVAGNVASDPEADVDGVGFATEMGVKSDGVAMSNVDDSGLMGMTCAVGEGDSELTRRRFNFAVDFQAHRDER